VRVCGLAVQLRERERPRVREEAVQVVDGIEDGDNIEESGQAAYNVLCENGFRDVDPGTRELFSEMRYAVPSRG
jgi:hypothetical protein